VKVIGEKSGDKAENPNIRHVSFDIPKDCRLRKYSDQLVGTFRGKSNQDFINFRDELFHDSLAFVRSELGSNDNPLITVEFVYSKKEYERIEKESNQNVYQEEKPIGETLGFTITSPLGNNTYINFEPLLELLKINYGVFVFNYINTLIHEILHCFFRNSKDEQEIHDLQYVILEKFLGVRLPDEMKKTKASDYYKKSS
jgi:hypothetical protein